MKKLRIAGMLISMVLLLITIATTAEAATPEGARKGPGKGHGEEWVIWTYTPLNEYAVPVAMPVKKLKGGDVSFDLFINGGSPDRAMLITEKFPKGTLNGHSLSARIAIIADGGTTFNYCHDQACNTYDTGGFVRLYIEGVNPDLCNCERGWHPERPDCEAQYWWSNPIAIDLEDLALLGTKGTTLQVVLSPAFWSDRDGHMGDTPKGDVCWAGYDDIPAGCMSVDHAAAFNAAVANATRMGLSFGGGNNFAFGVGANQSATFVLYDFSTKK